MAGDRLEPVPGFAEAPGRETWYTPWGGPPDVRSLARGPEGSLFVNVHVGGVLRWGPGAGGWRPTLDIDADVHQVVAHPTRPGVVLVAAAAGLGISEDGGGTWSFTIEGLAATYCRAVAVADDRIFLSASRGPSGGGAALYRTSFGERRLTRLRGGLPERFSTNIDTHCLAARGDEVVAADPAGAVYFSGDGGETWERRLDDLPRVHAVAFDRAAEITR